MNIEIKSTSYLIPNNSSWESLHKNNKLKFSEYNNIFNNTKFNQKTECEIFIDASLTSMQSTGQTVIQAPQKSHLFSLILIMIYQKCRIM